MNTGARIKPSPEIISLAERAYGRLWAVNYTGELGRKERLEDVQRIAQAMQQALAAIAKAEA